MTRCTKATYEGQERPAFTRIAEMDGAIYLDLANAAWEAVRIDASGWQVVQEVPVRFIRRRGIGALPIPANGCRLEELRRFVNLRDDADWLLQAAWIVAAFRLRGPYPILILHGEQGSAKSSLARVARELVDPNSAPLRSEPRDARDLIIAANNSWVLAFDNLSHLLVWFSDALCRLATGGGFSTRDLYTDSEEVLFDAVRPVILNGIEELATRGDLLDRALILYLPQIADGKRRREADFWKDFEAARPQLLGAILDAVSAGLRNLPTINLKESPRMADFAAWAAAAEPAFGVKGLTFAQAYKGNRESANDLVLDSSHVAQAVKDFAADGSFRGTATDLLAAINQKVGEETRREKAWPKDGRALSNRLRRLAPNLRQVGVSIQFDLPAGRGKGKKRVIQIEKLRDLASPASPEPENDGEERTFPDVPVGTLNAMGTETAPPAQFSVPT